MALTDGLGCSVGAGAEELASVRWSAAPLTGKWSALQSGGSPGIGLHEE